MPPSDSEARANEKVAKDWHTAPHPLTTPFTAGSDQAFTAAAFGPAHYAQEDTSLNETLWSLWPISSPEELEDVLKDAEEKRDELVLILVGADTRRLPAVSKNGSFDKDKLRAGLPQAERVRMATMVRLIGSLHAALNTVGRLEYGTLVDGQSPYILLKTRQTLLDVPPLDRAIESARRFKKEGDVLNAKAGRIQNGGPRSLEHMMAKATMLQYGDLETVMQMAAQHFSAEVNELAGAAVGKYCSALLALWPWTASGLIMSPEVAFSSGIAELENELWWDIGLTCYRQFRIGPDCKAGDDTFNATFVFAMYGRLANLIPVHTRYVPYKTLHRALGCASLNGLVFSQFKSDQWLSELQDGDRLNDLCIPGAANAPDAWAHGSCDTKHKGCLGIGFSLHEKLGAGDRVTKLNEEREANSDLLAEESSSYYESLKAKSEVKGRWSYDKEGKKTYGPKTADKRKAFYLPDGSVEFL